MHVYGHLFLNTEISITLLWNLAHWLLRFYSLSTSHEKPDRDSKINNIKCPQISDNCLHYRAPEITAVFSGILDAQYLVFCVLFRRKLLFLLGFICRFSFAHCIVYSCLIYDIIWLPVLYLQTFVVATNSATCIITTNETYPRSSVIGTDCIGSCQSNYRTTTNTPVLLTFYSYSNGLGIKDDIRHYTRWRNLGLCYITYQSNTTYANVERELLTLPEHLRLPQFLVGFLMLNI
jgi:hypothetical protein